MAFLKPSRGSQWPLVKEFIFSFGDYVTDSVDLTKKTLGATPAVANPDDASIQGPAGNTITLDALPLPAGAVITGGEVITETAYAGPATATVSIGVAGSLTALASAVDLKTAARTALTLTAPLVANDGKNLRATITYAGGNATAGKARLRVAYTIDNRSNEVQAS